METRWSRRNLQTRGYHPDVHIGGKESPMSSHRVAVVDFAHIHVADHLRSVRANPDTELVAVCDGGSSDTAVTPEGIATAVGLPESRVFDEYTRCLAETTPDIVVLCAVPADHAVWIERLAPYDVDIVLEKPLATSVADADRICEAVGASDNRLAVNWPLAWDPAHRTTKRLLAEGRVGDPVDLHYYGGNRGPGRTTWEPDPGAEFDLVRGEPKDDAAAAETWWHDPDRGGGSLTDYLGYGVTLGTWFRNGDLPETVTAETYSPEWTDVDTQSVTIARYETGLSTFRTRWGTFTDPWIHQPQPTSGFVVVGTEGTIRSDDYADVVCVQDRSHPEGRTVDVDETEPPRDTIQYLVECIERNRSVEWGPLHPGLCRDAQRITDAARRSADRGGPVRLD